MKNKSLSARQNKKGREALRVLINNLFPSQAAAAKAFDVSPPAISDFLSGKRGAGPKLLMGVAAIDPNTAALMLGADFGERQLEGETAAALGRLIKDGIDVGPATHAVLAAQAMTEGADADRLYTTAKSMLAVASVLNS